MNNIKIKDIPSLKNTRYLENIFTASQWEVMESIIDELARQPELFEQITYGNGALEAKKFSLSIYKFISRLNGISSITDSIYTRQMLQVIENSPLIEQINLLSNKNLSTLRMQLNCMHQDSYVQCHTDYESDKAYVCSILIRVGSCYSGGELIIYDEEGEPQVFQQSNRSVLLMSSRSPHEVKVVQSGVRYTICLFCG